MGQIPIREDLLASMRPGQSCPGVGPRSVIVHVRDPMGFNEAGAIMPRSGPSIPTPPTAAAIGFNEAGAIMPRSGTWERHSSVA